MRDCILFGHFDLNLIGTLAVLLQTKSVSGTARRLGVSQPAVSRSLAQLRTLLGDPLLVRSGRGMERTSRAEELVTPVLRWLASTSALIQPADFDPATLRRRFRIASTDYGVMAVIARMLPTMNARAPATTIDVVPLGEAIMDKLAAGEIDLIITGLEPDRSMVHERPLFAESFTCIVRPGHPLAGTDEPVAIADFLAWPHVSFVVGDREVDLVDERLGALAARRNVIARLPYFCAAPDFVAESDVVLTMPTRAAIRLAAAHGLAARRAPVEIGPLDYWVVWHERNARDPGAMWLVDMLARQCGRSSDPSIHPLSG